jgi:hypothetical protein
MCVPTGRTGMWEQAIENLVLAVRNTVQPLANAALPLHLAATHDYRLTVSFILRYVRAEHKDFTGQQLDDYMG